MVEPKANSRLREFVASSEPIRGTLPFVHTTNTFRFDKITIADVISPRRCKFFKKELIYLFYGRPSYRTKVSFRENLSFDWPIVFVMNEIEIEKQIRRAFPFDTGAFHTKKYDNFFDVDSPIEDFELLPSLDFIQRYIGAFYQNNHEYLTGSSRKNVDISIDNFEAAGLHELARQPADPIAGTRIPADERASAIEIQLEKPIDIKKSLIGIVIPERCFDVKKWVEAIDRWNPNYIEKYSIVNSTHPEFYAGQVYNLVLKIIADSGYRTK